MRRRDFLATLAAGTALAACAGQVPVAQWVAGLQAVGQEFSLVAPQLQAAGLGGSALAQAQSIIGQIIAAAGAISNASAAAQGQSTLLQIEGYINALAPLVAPFAAGVPGLGLIVAALPAIEALLNVTSALVPATQQLVAAHPTAARMSAQQALAELLRQTGH